MKKSIPKYKILFLMNGAKPPRGGEFMTLYLITHLRKDIFHPVLFYIEDGTIIREIKKAGIEAIPIYLPEKIAHIYPREIKLYNPIFLFSFLWQFISSNGIFKLKKLIRQNKVQLIYCADNLSKLLGGLAGKMAKIKVVAPCHDDFKEDVLGKIMRIFYLLLLDRILAVSDKVRSFFLVNGNNSHKVITVYNGINADLFNPDNVDDNIRAEFGIRREAVVIGSIGALEQDKGQRYLFEALKKLLSEDIATNIVCIICGTGPEEDDLKEFIRKENLNRKVLFLGFRNDIPRILKALDILAVTSLTIESFSMAAVEAMTMKVPVIATNVGGLPEVVKDGSTGLIVPPGNVDALCNAIKYLVKNPEVRIKMGENARARVLEHFTIEKNVRKTEEVFLEMLRGD